MTNNKNTLLKVIILGDGGVGKSCLMTRYVNDQFETNTFHTIGVEFLSKDISIKDDTYTLQIWDTAGQERFKSLRTPFYRGSDICLLTFSVDDKFSFQNLNTWKNEFLNYADVRDGSKFPFIVVGNKTDLIDKRKVTAEEAEQWCELNGNYPYIETSAKDATNVAEAFMSALKIWISLEATLDKPYFGQTVDLSKKQSQRACC
uniref:small monomeric GTPase n=1 Tax=Strigamia maritima TaxID=126957 RepID=T1J1P7_STRMM